MCKKILIIINNFNIGGTIISLYSLLSKIDTTRISVYIFPRINDGSYAGKLPNCTILSENIWLSHTILNKCLFVRKLNYLLLCLRKVLETVGIDLYKVFNYIGGKKIHTDEYDAIIGFDETLVKYVSSLPAKKRINWIHCDYRRSANGKDESCYYDKINTIVCVSEFAKKIFCSIYPKYESKTIAIHNIINVEDLLVKASKPIDDEHFNHSDFTILSCGRMDSVKQFQLIPTIANKLKNKTQKKFHWYIIGGGNDVLYNQIETDINHLNLTNCVILLGMKCNPYPYFKNSDLLVCTSSSESYPMVVNEAKALQIPVICNTFPSASESIQNGINGFIVDIDSMPEKIIQMMEHPLIIDKYNNENNHILEQFYNLI